MMKIWNPLMASALLVLVGTNTPRADDMIPVYLQKGGGDSAGGGCPGTACTPSAYTPRAASSNSKTTINNVDVSSLLGSYRGSLQFQCPEVLHILYSKKKLIVLNDNSSALLSKIDEIKHDGLSQIPSALIMSMGDEFIWHKPPGAFERLRQSVVSKQTTINKDGHTINIFQETAYATLVGSAVIPYLFKSRTTYSEPKNYEKTKIHFNGKNLYLEKEMGPFNSFKCNFEKVSDEVTVQNLSPHEYSFTTPIQLGEVAGTLTAAFVAEPTTAFHDNLKILKFQWTISLASGEHLSSSTNSSLEKSKILRRIVDIYIPQTDFYQRTWRNSPDANFFVSLLSGIEGQSTTFRLLLECDNQMTKCGLMNDRTDGGLPGVYESENIRAKHLRLLKITSPFPAHF